MFSARLQGASEPMFLKAVVPNKFRQWIVAFAGRVGRIEIIESLAEMAVVIQRGKADVARSEEVGKSGL